MILKTRLLQDSCRKILDAVDDKSTLKGALSDDVKVSETLELEAKEQNLYLNVTNKEYYVSVKIPLEEDIEFHATVSAKLFLNLISKVTTTDIELTTDNDRILFVKANGNYKLPLACDNNGAIISLPKIAIDNVTNEFVIKNDILQSIVKYNSKEMLKGVCAKPSQKLFYIDERGALTYTTGACVNNFTLEQPVSLYLTEKIVKLFRLFKHDVNFSLGHDVDEQNRDITKVSFTDGEVCLVSKINIDSSITNTFPVTSIRELSETSHQYNINLDKVSLLDAINRLSLFASKTGIAYTFISFGEDSCTVYDCHKDNFEEITYTGDSLMGMTEPYLAMFNTLDLKLTLETCDETHINLGFGNHRAVIISRGAIKTIVPECKQ